MSVAASWTGFVEGRFKSLDAALNFSRSTAVDKGKAAPPLVPADDLRGFSMLLAQLVAARGVRATQPHFEFFMPLASGAAESVTTDQDADYVTVDGVVWFINLTETTGLAPVGAFDDAVESWLAALAPLAASFDRPDRLSLAFSALAFEIDDAVPRIMGEPLPANAPPGVAFQFDYPSLLGYLAAACRDRAGFDAVQPAWLDFLESFPYKIAAKSVEWPVLFSVARVVYHRIQGLPVADVARTTHQQIMQLIAQGK